MDLVVCMSSDLKFNFDIKMLIFKNKKSRGLLLGLGSSQLDNWAHKCHYHVHTLIKVHLISKFHEEIAENNQTITICLSFL